MSVRQTRLMGRALVFALVAVALVAATSGFASETHTTKPFTGVKVNLGEAPFDQPVM